MRLCFAAAFCKCSAAKGIAGIRCDSRLRFSVSPNTPSGRSGLKTTSLSFFPESVHPFADESNGSPSRNRRYFAKRHPQRICHPFSLGYWCEKLLMLEKITLQDSAPSCEATRKV
jgi:hypothetical protein